MGKLNLGILGGFSGTVGTVVGSTNKNGDDIIRARSKKPRTSNSAGQLKQQTKFGLVIGFMQGVNPVVKTGLKRVAAAEKLSPYNFACRYALNNAVTGTDAQPVIDYGKVMLSDGELSRDMQAKAVYGPEGVLFSWSEYVPTMVGSANDTVSILVTMSATGSLVSPTSQCFVRHFFDLALPYHESGDTLLFYLFFRSATDSLVLSTSQFLGSVVVD
jgi:hypothetical protein